MLSGENHENVKCPAGPRYQQCAEKGPVMPGGGGGGGWGWAVLELTDVLRRQLKA